MAPTRTRARAAFDRFIETHESKHSKAAECLRKDRDALPALYDVPAEHWVHLGATTPIASAFASIRHRSDRTKGCMTRATMFSLMFKLAIAADQSFR